MAKALRTETEAIHLAAVIAQCWLSAPPYLAAVAHALQTERTVDASTVGRIPQWVDSVEKVSKMKLWNQSLKQSNPSKWSFNRCYSSKLA